MCCVVAGSRAMARGNGGKPMDAGEATVTNLERVWALAGSVCLYYGQRLLEPFSIFYRSLA